MLRIERIRSDIVALSQLAAAAQKQRHEALALALQWWANLPDADAVRGHVQPLLQPASSPEPGWAGAIPTTPALPGTPIPCDYAELKGAALIGVDGSQIFPDRHALTLYYLIQVGAVIFRYNGKAPDVHVGEWLHYKEDELFDAQGYLIGGDVLGMERMIKEMEVLAELTAREGQLPGGPVIGLADGPLLWPYADRGRTTGEKLSTYLDAMQAMQQAGGVPIGYVDRPGGRPLLDLLWACHLPSEELETRWRDSPLQSLDDEVLMLHILASGERTTWFTRPTATNARHAGAGQEVWFCYQRLDSGEAGYRGHPTLARIEAPAWAVLDGKALNVMHAALLHQAHALNGYPYVLARAHEEALVTTQDKTALEQSIQRELFGAGVFAEASDKAQQKLLLGRRG